VIGSFVLDASALLAFEKGERGAARVAEVLKHVAVMNTVNWAEVLSKWEEWGRQPDEALRDLALSAIELVAFDERDATEVASLRVSTRTAGLSLADRSCLATARRLNLPVLTADRNWAGLGVGVRVEEIR